MRAATGVQYERRTRDILTAEGYECLRSAGSLGAADLMAGKRGQSLLIQVKRVSVDDPPMSRVVSHSEWNRLYEQAQATGSVPLIAAWTGKRKSRLQFIELTGRHAEQDEHWPARPFVIDQVAESWR